MFGIRCIVFVVYRAISKMLLRIIFRVKLDALQLIKINFNHRYSQLVSKLDTTIGRSNLHI